LKDHLENCRATRRDKSQARLSRGAGDEYDSFYDSWSSLLAMDAGQKVVVPAGAANGADRLPDGQKGSSGRTERIENGP
jgi:hypothetical protein